MSKLELLNPQNSAVIFIDHQPQMAFGVANIDRQQLKNNTVGRQKQQKFSMCRQFIPPLKQKASADISGLNYWPSILNQNLSNVPP